MRRGTQEVFCVHLNPRARGRTRPLGRPRVDALRPLGWVLPRDEAGTRDCRESEVENFLGVGLEVVAGLSTKDKSVVMNVVSPSASPRSVLRDRAGCSSFCFALRNDSAIGPSGKSTQKAFMFSPYKKLAKLSPKRARLSCMSWKCIMLASRSATASDNSAKAGSKVFRGKGSWPSTLRWADSRKEDRDEGRRGVVGRDRELERARLVVSWPSLADMALAGWRFGDTNIVPM